MKRQNEKRKEREREKENEREKKEKKRLIINCRLDNSVAYRNIDFLFFLYIHIGVWRKRNGLLFEKRGKIQVVKIKET